MGVCVGGLAGLSGCEDDGGESMRGAGWKRGGERCKPRRSGHVGLLQGRVGGLLLRAAALTKAGACGAMASQARLYRGQR